MIAGTLKAPPDRSAGVGRVAAERAGLDRRAERLAQVRIVLGDPFNRAPDGAGYAEPSAHRRGHRAAVTARKAYRALQFAREHIDLDLGPRGAFLVAEFARLVDLIEQLVASALLPGRSLLCSPRFAAQAHLLRGDIFPVSSDGPDVAIGVF